LPNVVGAGHQDEQAHPGRSGAPSVQLVAGRHGDHVRAHCVGHGGRGPDGVLAGERGQQPLVVQRDVGRRADGGVRRLAGRDDLRVVQVPGPPGIDLGSVAVGAAHRRDAGPLLLGRQGQRQAEPQRRGHLVAQVLRQRPPRAPPHDLVDEPGRRGQVELQLLPRRIVEAPPGEGGEPLLAVDHPRVAQRREREAGGVGEHVLDGHRLLPVGAELRDDRGDGLGQREPSLAQQLPRRAGHEGPAHRLQHVPGNVGFDLRVPPRLEGHQPAVAGDGELGGGQRAVLDLQPGPAEQDLQAEPVDPDRLGGDDLGGRGGDRHSNAFLGRYLCTGAPTCRMRPR
jgi:hypothetical protein